jgi:hypothetical protein
LRWLAGSHAFHCLAEAVTVRIDRQAKVKQAPLEFVTFLVGLASPKITDQLDQLDQR